MDITKIDKNFEIKNMPEGIEPDYFDARSEQFKLFGVKYEDGLYRRMPDAVAKSVSDGVHWLHTNTAGGRICFKTTSSFVCITAKIPEIGKMSHFTTLGSAGFDLYIKDKFTSVFVPDYNFTDGYSGFTNLKNNDMKEITINFPLYSNVSELIIGLEKGAVTEAFNPYLDKAPVVYYGSSITQGGCASRPGNSYQSEIARQTNVDYINLGFSGNAKGEDEMAEYIASLDMSVFVMDYDHNAPTPQHLKETHEKFFKLLRKKHPDLPVIFASKPDYDNDYDGDERRDVVYTTYINAVRAGDKNVYFIDGNSFFAGVERSFCTVDRCHPNDMGFYMMATVIGNAVKRALNGTL